MPARPRPLALLLIPFLQNNSSQDIEKLFPEALKDPILRKVQFSTISRIDELVNYVFDEFKHDYFPHEDVDITLENGEQHSGTIREKAKFEALRNPDGSIQRPGFARYFVKVNSPNGDEALVDDKHIKRSRKVFTKQNLRSFLKNSLRRDPVIGAPWLVKEHIAFQYRLPMDIPPHMVQPHVVVSQFPASSPQARAAESLKPLPLPLSARHAQGGSTLHKANGRKGKSAKTGHFEQENQQQVVHAFLLTHPNHAYLTFVQPHAPPQTQPNGNHVAIKPEVQRPVPPVKYPIEDLDLAPKRNGNTRPKLKFVTPDEPTDADVRPESVGKLLEVWNTLNVQCQFFDLDSFTFDDFVEAMSFSSADITCELLEEIHCAVLKQIVNEEGALQVTLPDMALAEDSDSEQEESEPATPIIDVPARSTRSRLSQVLNAEAKERASKSPSESRHRPHRAPEMLSEYGWVERLKARDFADGGWQTIMVGLLYQLSLNPRQKQQCDKILAQLAPLDEEPTQQIAWQQYVNLDVNTRISALQMITLLAVSTKALREYLEQSSEDQTDIRKRRLEWQKQRKAAMAKLAELDNQRKIMLPDNLPESPKEEHGDPMDISISHMDDTLRTTGTPTSDIEDDDDGIGGRSLRRANERKRKRNEDTARRDKEREEKERAKLAKTNSKQSKEFVKVLNEIQKLKAEIVECEAEIDDCEADLREASNHRTKVLGRDRFWNRYYWFERNGMPFAGLPDASTSEYGYANGRIWVQGPDDMERLGFIEVYEPDQQAYLERFGMTIPERKKQEEGLTHLRTAEEWGYYDDPESIKTLVGWLEDKGVREKALKKELNLFEDVISKHMNKLKERLDPEKQKEDVEEEPVTRMSTRHKVYVDTDVSGQRCLKWHNYAAVDSLGHLHSEQPKRKEKKGKKAAKEEKGVARPSNSKAAKPEARQTRSKK